MRRRLLSWSTVLALCALSPAQAGPTPPTDTLIAAYPVDAAGCSALKAGGKFTVDVNPVKMRNRVSGGAGMQFAAFIFPDSPVFRFYADNQPAFLPAGPGFSPSMRCITSAVYGSDNLLHFEGLPPGKYILCERTNETASYMGDDESETAEPEPGPNGSIELVPRITHTAVTRQYDRTALLGSETAISAGGNVTVTEPKVLYSEGY